MMVLVEVDLLRRPTRKDHVRGQHDVVRTGEHGVREHLRLSEGHDGALAERDPHRCRHLVRVPQQHLGSRWLCLIGLGRVLHKAQPPGAGEVDLAEVGGRRSLRHRVVDARVTPNCRIT